MLEICETMQYYNIYIYIYIYIYLICNCLLYFSRNISLKSKQIVKKQIQHSFVLLVKSVIKFSKLFQFFIHPLINEYTE